MGQAMNHPENKPSSTHPYSHSIPNTVRMLAWELCLQVMVGSLWLFLHICEIISSSEALNHQPIPYLHLRSSSRAWFNCISIHAYTHSIPNTVGMLAKCLGSPHKSSNKNIKCWLLGDYFCTPEKSGFTQQLHRLQVSGRIVE